MTPRQAEIVAAVERYGSIKGAARALGLHHTTVKEHYDKATRDPAIHGAMQAVGTGLVPSVAWIKTKPTDDAPGFSVMLRPQEDDLCSFKDMLREEIALAPTVQLPPRFDPRDGFMLVLDPSDVHIGKLCVATETGYTYDAATAEHRLYEGCRALIDQAGRNGVTRVLLVLGNDISHIDTPRRTTTSGTPQDVDGSIFTIFRAARNAYGRVIKYALECALEVQLVFVPSNHDWVLGYCLAEVIAASFGKHPNVTATEYAISERHRKYVRFGRNLIGFTHGDGARETDLPQIMLQEAGRHIADCQLRYWYVHHYHHKIRKALGIRPMAREKDHIAMTVISGGAGAMEGDNVAVEYVRSPSPPDGWHDRNGYLNRQAVEAFIHCPDRGQIMRLTEWF